MTKKTIRLLMPQWQGGNNDSYPLGAELLSWLAPKSSAPIIEVPVDMSSELLNIEDGLVAREILLKQLNAAHHILEAHEPDRIVIFGGDCLIGQAPYAYLNERYEGELGMLWLDAHTDLSTPNESQHGHAMVLGNLLGEGDKEFADKVNVPLNPKNVMFAGLMGVKEQESEIINRLGIRVAGPDELAENSSAVLNWITDNNIKNLAIHLDLDVLNPKLFRSLGYSIPGQKYTGSSLSGEMTFSQVARLIKDVSRETDVVGLGITEHKPWDAINVKNFLAELPILG